MTHEYIIFYKNGEVATCCTAFYLKKLTRFRRVDKILKGTVINSCKTCETLTKREVRFEKDF